MFVFPREGSLDFDTGSDLRNFRLSLVEVTSYTGSSFIFSSGFGSSGVFSFVFGMRDGLPSS